MATTPVVFLLSQNGKQVLLFSTFSIDQDAYQYSGQWNAGVFHGQGSYLYDGGERYEGQWKNGQIHGYGTYTWSNGDKWFGHFRDDRISGEEGLNVLTTADQTRCIGTWKWHGKWHKFWNGSQYNNRGELVARYSEGQMECVSRHGFKRGRLSQTKFKRGQLSRSKFKRGQPVRHWKFGRGSIVSMRGNHAQVRFESVGTKWLVLTYADLAID